MNFVCGVPGGNHEGDLHEWEIGKPGMGTIILCAGHEVAYITKNTTPRPAICRCCVCRWKETFVVKRVEEADGQR